MSDPADKTELRLLYANHTVRASEAHATQNKLPLATENSLETQGTHLRRQEADILLRAELDELAAAHPGRLRIKYFVSKGPAPGAFASLRVRHSTRLI